MLALEAGWKRAESIGAAGIPLCQGQRSDGLLASAFGPVGICFALFFVKSAEAEGPGEQTCQEEMSKRR